MAEFSAPIGWPIISGITRKNHRITITSGIERIRFTYHVATIARGPILDNRANANSVPDKIPTAMAIKVRLAVNFNPVHRNGRLAGITLQSNWLHMAAPYFAPAM